MQQPELRAQIQRYVATHTPFVKAVLLSELINDSEVFRYMSSDIEFRQVEEGAQEPFQIGLHEAMCGMYKEFKVQMTKLDNCQRLNITVMYDKYLVRKEQISKNLLLITISETPKLDMGSLDTLVKHLTNNFAPIDAHLQQLNT